jgi:hypothetical protein
MDLDCPMKIENGDGSINKFVLSQYSIKDIYIGPCPLNCKKQGLVG